MKFGPKILSVGCWNIEGIYQKINGVRISKLDDESFETTLNQFDILCLQETHTSQKDAPKFKNFVPIPHCREISGNKRYFGGMLLFIRKTIRKGVKVNCKVDVDSLEVILNSVFFLDLIKILEFYLRMPALPPPLTQELGITPSSRKSRPILRMAEIVF